MNKLKRQTSKCNEKFAILETTEELPIDVSLETSTECEKLFECNPKTQKCQLMDSLSIYAKKLSDMKYMFCAILLATIIFFCTIGLSVRNFLQDL